MLTFEEIKGKTIFVGINYYNTKKKLVGRRQIYGTIVSASAIGIKIKMQGGKDFTLPPDLKAIRPAKKGEYGVLPSGEKITDPDYLSVWDLVSN